MNITEVRMTKLNGEGNTKALATVTIDGSIALTGMRVVEGKNGSFVSMPQRKGKDKEGKDTWYDIYFPVTKEARQVLIDAVLNEYNKDGGAATPAAEEGFMDIPDGLDDDGDDFPFA